jgi:uncharacterized protein with PIN domain
MALDDKYLKARLMAEAEEAIDRLLGGKREQEELQLSDIERLVRTAGEQVMERFTNEIVAEEAQSVESRICPECGQKMRYKGRKARDLVTETGEVRLERAYYYCPRCQKGFFPPRPSMESE